MARIEQGEKARKEVAKPSNPKLRLRTRLMETVNRIFTSKQEKLSDQKELLHGMSRRRMLALSAAAIVAACAPLPAAAQDTTPAKGKEVAAETGKKTIEYETFSDPSELAPLFDNAKGKFVKIEKGETKQIGEYSLKVYFEGENVVVFQSTPKGESPKMITLNDKLCNTNILVVDAPENSGFTGKMLVFADSYGVYFQYFSKKEGKHSLLGVPLWEGKMRKGPIDTGYAFDEGAIVVINAPKNLKPGDVVCQADYTPDVSGGTSYFVYAPEKPSGTVIAMR